MSPTSATRSAQSSAPTEQQALVPLSSAAIVASATALGTALADLNSPEAKKELTAIAGRLRRWGEKTSALPMVEGPGDLPVAVVIQDRAQELVVVDLFKEQKAIDKATEAHFKAVEKAARGWNTTKKSVKDLSKPGGGLLNAGIVLFRERLEREAVQAARKQAEADEAERAAEEQRLRDAARKLTGVRKRETLADARALADDRVDPVQAAQDARERTQQSFRGSGRAPTKTYYSARLDSLVELVCAVVASNPALCVRVRQMVSLMQKGECSLVGIAALSAHMPELNRRVDGDKEGLRIPGVTVVSRSSVANL